MVDYIRPKDLPAGVGPQPTGLAIPGDNGIEVVRVTPAQIVATGRPIATESQAIAGTDNTTTMTPLTTAQAMDSRLPGVMQPYVDIAQAWAESPTNPDPANMDSKSAKTWAGEAAISAAQAALYYTGPRFDTIQSLLTNASMSYGATPGGVSAGDFITTDQEAQAYQVVASGSASYDVATTGGVRLIVLPTPRGFNARAFGAVGDGVADDTGAIQLAMNAAETRQIGTVYVPAGKYKTTAPLLLPGSVSFVGDKDRTEFRPAATDFLYITSSGSIAPRTIADFWVYGHGTIDNTAIKANLSNATPAAQRAFRLMIERIYVSFFGMGLDLKGVWHCTLRSCMIHRCKNGVKIHGKSIKTLITDCSIQSYYDDFGAAAFSTGVQVGTNDDAEGLCPEGVTIRDTIIFGYRIAVDWVWCILGSVETCQLDYCNYGVRAAKPYHGFVVSNCWIGVGAYWGGYPIGIYLIEQPSALDALTVISGNTFVTYETYSLYHGIVAEPGHSHLHIRDNTIETGFTQAIRLTSTYNARVIDNICGSGNSTFETVDGLTLTGNVLTTPVVLNGNLRTDFGKNRGITTHARGQVSMPASATSVTRTWAELGIDPLPTSLGAGYGVIVEASAQGSLNRGNVWADYSTTGITVYVEVASGLAAGVSYEISVI